MKKNILMLLMTMSITIGILPTLTSASSLKSTHRVNKRQRHQNARIEKGIGNGSVSPDEAAKLKAEQYKVNNDKKAAKADGVVTKQEHRQLRREQNHAGHDIYKAKHN